MGSSLVSCGKQCHHIHKVVGHDNWQAIHVLFSTPVQTKYSHECKGFNKLFDKLKLVTDLKSTVIDRLSFVTSCQRWGNIFHNVILLLPLLLLCRLKTWLQTWTMHTQGCIYKIEEGANMWTRKFWGAILTLMMYSSHNNNYYAVHLHHFTFAS